MLTLLAYFKSQGEQQVAISLSLSVEIKVHLDESRFLDPATGPTYGMKLSRDRELSYRT